jgi:cytochrome c oxidase cbb3-type subunit 2
VNRLLLLWLGVAATVIASAVGLVLVPNWQMRGMAPVQVTDALGRTVDYPQALDTFDAAPGRQVYMAQGCIYCHSQQVRPASFGADIERGWGERRSVPRDYLLQAPPMLGTMRTGPDVANIGVRQPADAWHHLHLFDARLVTPHSVMPPFRYLYSVVHTDPGPSGYKLPDDYGHAGAAGPAWIVPSAEANHLVAYLKALQQPHALSVVQ